MKIVVIVDGGIVSCVYADEPAKIEVLDLDDLRDDPECDPATLVASRVAGLAPQY